MSSRSHSLRRRRCSHPLLVLLGHLGADYVRSALINLIHQAVIMLPSHGPWSFLVAQSLLLVQFPLLNRKPMQVRNTLRFIFI